MTGTKVRDLQGQRTMVIDARAKTVFIDADGFCYEFDKGLLLNALRKELGAQACYTCVHALAMVA